MEGYERETAVLERCWEEDQRWVGIERGGHAITHCARRLQLVIDGDKALERAARVADGWSIKSLARAMGAVSMVTRVLPLPMARPRLATSEQLRPDMLRVIRRAVSPAVVAIYDDPVAQDITWHPDWSPR